MSGEAYRGRVSQEHDFMSYSVAPTEQFTSTGPSQRGDRGLVSRPSYAPESSFDEKDAVSHGHGPGSAVDGMTRPVAETDVFSVYGEDAEAERGGQFEPWGTTQPAMTAPVTMPQGVRTEPYLTYPETWRGQSVLPYTRPAASLLPSNPPQGAVPASLTPSTPKRGSHRKRNIFIIAGFVLAVAGGLGAGLGVSLGNSKKSSGSTAAAFVTSTLFKTITATSVYSSSGELFTTLYPGIVWTEAVSTITASVEPRSTVSPTNIVTVTYDKTFSSVSPTDSVSTVTFGRFVSTVPSTDPTAPPPQ